MAILSGNQLTELRRVASAEVVPMRLTKTLLNAAMQAIEDTFELASVRNAFSSALDTATSPITLTAAEKRALVKYWLKQRFDRGN